MPAFPAWALTLTYWIHFLAAVTLLGSILATAILILPAAQTLNPVDQLNLIATIEKRMEPAAWFSISVLIVTGLFQMSVNVHYNGFLSVSTQWTIAILVKHILVVTLIVVSAMQSWDVLPSIRRLLLRKDNASQEKAEKLKSRAVWLVRANLVLGILILAATAFMRSA